MRRTTDDHGASAVEYAIIVSLIAAVIVALVYSLGVSVRGNMETACTALDEKIAQTGDC